MDRLHHLVAISLIVIVSAGFANAQATASIVVSVSDPNGNIVAGASSKLSAAISKKNAVSSDLGVLAYRNLRPGKYELTITVEALRF